MIKKYPIRALHCSRKRGNKMEKLRLINGTEFDLVVNGIRAVTNGIALQIIKPEGMTLEEIREVFKNPENTNVMKVVKEETTLRIETGFVKLGNRITMDDHAPVGVNVTENEDGTTESETVYAAVVGLEMLKETIEDKVEANRADIDYLLMMEE